MENHIKRKIIIKVDINKIKEKNNYLMVMLKSNLKFGKIIKEEI